MADQTPPGGPAPEPSKPAAAPVKAEAKPAPAAAKTPVKGYGKRPMWQWVVIYLIIALVVYGLVWYFFFRSTGGSTGGSIY